MEMERAPSPAPFLFGALFSPSIRGGAPQPHPNLQVAASTV
jgi:hypothetical protein